MRDIKTILCVFGLILTCVSSASTLNAQGNKCLPSVTLSNATEPNIFSEEQEIFLGEAVAEYIQKDYRIIEDEELTAYLSRVGNRLIKHLPLTKLQFRFFLVDLPDANAFVLPGGRIYVSRKLVALSQSEDELAGIIAHELGHLVAHDTAVSATRRLKDVLGITQVTDRADIFDKYNRLIDNFRRKPEAFKTRDREKDQLDADRIGFYAFVKAGYDPIAQSRFWDRLTETKGKTGSWFSDFFGTTRPEEKRLREMLKAVENLPAECKDASSAKQNEEFKKWQSVVVSYSGLGRRESLHGVLSKQQLSPPLRNDIRYIRFSQDGKYILAQDYAGINVLTREPFASIFRIEAQDANYARFSPDSQSVIFYTDNLRVERWSINEQKMIEAKEVVIRKGCLQTELSPDGKYLACLGGDFGLTLVDVNTNQTVFQKKEFYATSYYHFLWILSKLFQMDSSIDAGLDLINMSFSPDGHYFLAGFYGPLALNSRRYGNVAEAVDITTLSKISLPDSVKNLVGGGFTFMGNERLVGVNEEDNKKSGMVSFPSGQSFSSLPIWRRGISSVTRGNYLMIRPVKDYPLGIMDINTQKFFKVSERAALDIYDNFIVSEMINGEIGLYRTDKNEAISTTLLTNISLGRLYVGELSSDMKLLAISGHSRGGVWNLTTGEGLLLLRGFRGGHFSDKGYFFGDFPKYETEERNIAAFNLKDGSVVPGAKIESGNVRQMGEYVSVLKSAKTDANENDFEAYRKNVTHELLDAVTMKPLWSKHYPKEVPRVWVSPVYKTVALVWNVTDDAAKTEIKSDAMLSGQMTAMKEKEGDYFLKILDAQSGNELGRLLIETGKGSFRLSNVFAINDWVIVTDTQNRVLVYSLKTGELKGRVFGGFATVSPKNKLLCVENETGKLTVYNLDTMERLDQFIFSNPLSLLRFSEDGKRLFVMTSKQTVYLLDTSLLGKSPQ